MHALQSWNSTEPEHGVIVSLFVERGMLSFRTSILLRNRASLKANALIHGCAPRGLKMSYRHHVNGKRIRGISSMFVATVLTLSSFLSILSSTGVTVGN